MKTGKYLDSQICLHYYGVFCVEALALTNIKRSGREKREREKILPKKKKEKKEGGVKISLHQKEVRRKTDYSLDISRWRYSRH